MARNKYRKVPVTFSRSPSSLSETVNKALTKSVNTFIFLGIFMFFAPFAFQGKKRQYHMPSNVNSYLYSIIPFLGLLMAVILLVIIYAIIDYYRNLRDYKAGYIKVGDFEVYKIFNAGDFKRVHLKNGKVIKINYEDNEFNRISVGDIVEIKRTASNKFLEISF